MSSKIVRYYVAENNPDRRLMPDATQPADITEEEWAGYSEYYQQSVDDLPFFRKTKPPAAKPEAAEEAK